MNDFDAGGETLPVSSPVYFGTTMTGRNETLIKVKKSRAARSQRQHHLIDMNLERIVLLHAPLRNVFRGVQRQIPRRDLIHRKFLGGGGKTRNAA
ncbi:MAG TPA: hypothetical protein ENJ26_02210 [Rhodobacteraceae bacterium]|nr:hypothetical protein [Paracoccaceae bacterium]